MAIRIGTDCSGMEAPVQAIRNLGVNYDHKFSCDINKHAKTTIEANFPHDIFYPDLTTRNNKKALDVDIYVAGFPCQPFSSAGLQQGFGDKKGRGEIFFDVLDYIAKRKPRVFILENVSGLTTLKDESGEKYLDAILKELYGLGIYNVSHKVLDTKEHGVPHSRRRWYCVGIRKEYDINDGHGQFEFPEKIPCPSIELFLEERDPKLAVTGLPPRSQSTALKNVKSKLREVQGNGENPHKTTHIVDCDSSPNRSKCVKGVSPCITVSRAAGHWVTSRGRRMTKEEMMRFQGMNPTTFTMAVTETQLGRQLGNTMSVNVFERLLVKVLPAAKLVRKNSLRDRWESGVALKELAATRGKGFMKAKKQVARDCSPSPRPAKRQRCA